MVSTMGIPFAAAAKARPMPVFPLVGSRRIVSFLIRPSRSAASIIATPIRSFTDEHGLKLSSFAATFARAPSMIRLSRTSGVLPMSFVMSSAMRMLGSLSRVAARSDFRYNGRHL